MQEWEDRYKGSLTAPSKRRPKDDPLAFLDKVAEELEQRKVVERRDTTMKRVTFALKVANVCLVVAAVCTIISIISLTCRIAGTC